MAQRRIRSLPAGGSQSNPWFGVSIFLGVLLAVSLLTNVFVLVSTGPTVRQQAAIPAPSGGAAAPSAPSAPVEVSVDDDPSIGTGKVTVIEFSDYQCPFCQRFDQQTWDQLKTNYIDTGKITFVYRDFPLSFHQNAQIAAEAAECADDQGKYWEMHEVLFTKGQGDGTGLDSASLKQYAADLKLNTKEFNDCLDSGKYTAEVQKDLADGSAAGVSGTPSFFVDGQLIVGAQPYSVFQQAIDAALAN